MSNAYIFSSRYVFYIHRDSVEEHLIAFLKTILSYSFTGILLNALFLYLLVDVSGVSCYKAQFFSLLITVPTNFILNKYWAFRK
ncbi:MAG: GtrA family protein [Akkermansia muciniphila]